MQQDLPSINLDQQLCFLIYSTNLALHQLYRKLLTPLGLTYPQYLVMLVLWEQDQIRVSDIGSRLFLESSTLTPLLKKLEGSGLLMRQRSTQDERQVIITLTAKGHDLKQQAAVIPQQVIDASTTPIEQLKTLQQQLKILRDTIHSQ